MKKKVLFVINHFRKSNGVAMALKNLVDNLNTDTYEIYILPIYQYDEDFGKYIEDKATILHGIGFYFRGLDKIVNLIPPYLLYKLFVKDDYDVEVAYQYGVPTKMISVSRAEKKLCWMHGVDEKLELKKYYDKYDKILTVSKSGCEKIVRAGIDNSKCDYCYNIIDENRIYSLSLHDTDMIKSHKYCVLTVCRLSPEKGLIRYLNCIKKICEEFEDCEFWIIGAGPEYRRLERFIYENNLGEYVKLLGQKDNPYKYVKEADFYFCGSYNEGFNTSCQEAAILGIPVVTVLVDGARELIELTKCGRVIENSETAIVNELSSILKNPKIISDWKEIANQTKSRLFKSERLKKIEYYIEL